MEGSRQQAPNIPPLLLGGIGDQPLAGSPALAAPNAEAVLDDPYAAMSQPGPEETAANLQQLRQHEQEVAQRMQRERDQKQAADKKHAEEELEWQQLQFDEQTAYYQEMAAKQGSKDEPVPASQQPEGAAASQAEPVKMEETNRGNRHPPTPLRNEQAQQFSIDTGRKQSPAPTVVQMLMGQGVDATGGQEEQRNSEASVSLPSQAPQLG